MTERDKASSVQLLRRVDLETAPTVETSALLAAYRKRFERYVKAVHRVAKGLSPEKAAGRTLSARHLRYLISQFMSFDPVDGRIRGYRALSAFSRGVEYQRVLPIRKGSGLAGAIQYVMRYQIVKNSTGEGEQTIEERLIDYLNGEGEYHETRPNKVLWKPLQDEFVSLCIASGLTEQDYPLCHQERGLRALKEWHKKVYMPRHSARAVRAEHGPDAATASAQAASSLFAIPKQPYDEWQIDAYCINCRARYAVLDEAGHWHDLELSRYWLLCLIDAASPCATLSWRIVLDAKPSQDDVMALIWQALDGQPKADRVLWDKDNEHYVDYQDGWGYPSVVIPALRFATGVTLNIDNALEHLGNNLRNTVQATCGMSASFLQGRVPKGRAQIEAAFAALTRQLLRQVPASTGSNPLDPIRKIADRPVHRRLLIAELSHAMDLYFARRNGEPIQGSAGKASLQYLRDAVERRSLRPVYLSEEKRRAHFFGPRDERPVITGPSRSAHINFDYVRYKGDCLKRYEGYRSGSVLVIVRADPADLRTLRLFELKSGAEIGIVKAEGRWGRLPHDRRIRAMHHKYSDGSSRWKTDPLRALYAHLRGIAPKDKRAATELAHMHQYLLGHSAELEQELRAEIEQAQPVRFAIFDPSEVAANDVELPPLLVHASAAAGQQSEDPPARASAPEPAPTPPVVVRLIKNAHSVRTFR